MSFQIEAQYHVVDGREVALSVRIGNSQMGGSVALLDGAEIARGPIERLILGDGQVLRGRKLEIRTVVADINPSTNNLLVTYVLEGGTVDQEFKTWGSVESDQAARHIAFFSFV